MNAVAVVKALLEDWTPPGYDFVDGTEADGYSLRLWRGEKHKDGRPVSFVELSLNQKGLSFDPDSQMQRHAGAGPLAARRGKLVAALRHWVKKYGTIYVGSYSRFKLLAYHRLLQRYLSGLHVTEPHAAFDESEGVPDYFTVSTTRAPAVD